MLPPPGKEGFPPADMGQCNSKRANRIGRVLQCGSEGATEPLEEISVDLLLEGENQALPTRFATAKIDRDAVHGHGILSILHCVIALQLHDEEAGTAFVPSPEAGQNHPAHDLADIEVRPRNANAVPR